MKKHLAAAGNLHANMVNALDKDEVYQKFMEYFQYDHLRLWGWKYEQVKAALREYQERGN
jgi:hypothetical protein